MAGFNQKMRLPAKKLERSEEMIYKKNREIMRLP
jgi:hypothetical protein